MTSRFGIAVTLLGAALLVTSSVGVSSVALERPIEIDVDIEAPETLEPGETGTISVSDECEAISRSPSRFG